MTEAIFTLPLQAGYSLYQRWDEHDPDARAEVGALFPAGSSCFLCDAPITDDFGLLVGQDPRKPLEDAIIAPLCAGCMALPPVYRLARLRKVMKAMWPQARRMPRLLTPKALRAMR
jgi:hypothetical protein